MEELHGVENPPNPDRNTRIAAASEKQSRLNTERMLYWLGYTAVDVERPRSDLLLRPEQTLENILAQQQLNTPDQEPPHTL